MIDVLVEVSSLISSISHYVPAEATSDQVPPTLVSGFGPNAVGGVASFFGPIESFLRLTRKRTLQPLMAALGDDEGDNPQQETGNASSSSLPLMTEVQQQHSLFRRRHLEKATELLTAFWDSILPPPGEIRELRSDSEREYLRRVHGEDAMDVTLAVLELPLFRLWLQIEGKQEVALPQFHSVVMNESRIEEDANSTTGTTTAAVPPPPSALSPPLSDGSRSSSDGRDDTWAVPQSMLHELRCLAERTVIAFHEMRALSTMVHHIVVQVRSNELQMRKLYEMGCLDELLGLETSGPAVTRRQQMHRVGRLVATCRALPQDPGDQGLKRLRFEKQRQQSLSSFGQSVTRKLRAVRDTRLSIGDVTEIAWMDMSQSTAHVTESPWRGAPSSPQAGGSEATLEPPSPPPSAALLSTPTAAAAATSHATAHQCSMVPSNVLVDLEMLCRAYEIPIPVFLPATAREDSSSTTSSLAAPHETASDHAAGTKRAFLRRCRDAASLTDDCVSQGQQMTSRASQTMLQGPVELRQRVDALGAELAAVRVELTDSTQKYLREEQRCAALHDAFSPTSPLRKSPSQPLSPTATQSPPPLRTPRTTAVERPLSAASQPSRLHSPPLRSRADGNDAKEETVLIVRSIRLGGASPAATTIEVPVTLKPSPTRQGGRSNSSSSSTKHRPSSAPTPTSKMERQLARQLQAIERRPMLKLKSATIDLPTSSSHSSSHPLSHEGGAAAAVDVLRQLRPHIEHVVVPYGVDPRYAREHIAPLPTCAVDVVDPATTAGKWRIPPRRNPLQSMHYGTVGK